MPTAAKPEEEEDDEETHVFPSKSLGNMANLEQTDDDPELGVTSTDKSAVLNSAPARDAFAVPCLIPSFADARELVNAPYSCLVLHTHRRHVALPPMYLNKKKTGIQQELNADLLKYSNRYLMFFVFGTEALMSNVSDPGSQDLLTCRKCLGFKSKVLKPSAVPVLFIFINKLHRPREGGGFSDYGALGKI